MSEIQVLYRVATDEQRLSGAEHLRSLATDPAQIRYWDGFIVGVRRVMAGEEVWGGGTTRIIDSTYPEIDCGVQDGWRGVTPIESSPRRYTYPQGWVAI